MVVMVAPLVLLMRVRGQLCLAQQRPRRVMVGWNLLLLLVCWLFLIQVRQCPEVS
jgi:hypothetical protein